MSELFYSFQGEGKRTGYPSFFIRTNLCNLRCKFFGGNLCDTPYTSWDFDNPDNLGELKIEDIISEYKKYFPCDVVITGGEPTIQGRELLSLCCEIKNLSASSFPRSTCRGRGTQNIYITLETNGTFIDDYVDYIDLVSISPKLNSSVPFGSEFEKGHNKNRLNYEVLKSYHEFHQKGKFDVQWKFVVTGKDDIPEIIELQKEIGFKNKDIFLMPEGITEKELSEKRLMVVELCKQYHFNFTDRLQIKLWGNKRGV
ncbi:MAG: 7-carboxy-7-deazaguanine synthase QueE [Ignavibacteriae bacterium]|nr:7-carboxy-7-deazaguanine synthase QueE [Ignavibacteriota bacterium]